MKPGNDRPARDSSRRFYTEATGERLPPKKRFLPTPGTVERRLCDALYALGWSQRELSRRLAQDERTVRRWAAGEYPAPPAVLAWLETLAAHHAAHPAPRQKAQDGA